MRLGLFPAVIVLIVATRAQAQSPGPVTPTSLAPASLAPAAPVSPAPAPRTDRVLTDGSASSEQAAEHFERALAWYREGKYRRAVGELEAALARDPGGKDLVFNLALVQEKLGDLSGAIASLRRFQSMEKDPKEIERANQTIERLNGAQAELLVSDAPLPVKAAVAEPCPTPRVRGKFDGWVIGTGSVALASLLVGTVFGVQVLTLDADHEQSEARDAAIVADVALATGLLAGAGSVALYFGRFADPPPRSFEDGVAGRAALAQGEAMPRAVMARLEFRY